MPSSNRSTEQYESGSLSLLDAVSMGTGVMVGAGVFALTGQMAAQAGGLFPLAFVSAAIITAFSAYSYVKLSANNPSAGGIAMYLKMAYGQGTATAGFSLLMYFSMVINESLVARTFATYTLELFDVSMNSLLVPALGVGLLLVTFFINLLGNDIVGKVSIATAAIKVGGIAIFAVVGLSLSGLTFKPLTSGQDSSTTGFLAATALGILAYKGFTTITNSGGELVDPKKNVGKAIILSLTICGLLYTLVAFAVVGSLSLEEIQAAKDYVLAEAARPLLGQTAVFFTVLIAIIATVSGVIASVFAVSRMLAMLTNMGLVPHRHFGMPGDVQTHTLVYTIVIAMVLTVSMDLSRIAAMGAFFYLVMDIAIHWGLLRRLRVEVAANPVILIVAILLDLLVLGALLVVKGGSDPLLLAVTAIAFLVIFAGEKWFLAWNSGDDA